MSDLHHLRQRLIDAAELPPVERNLACDAVADQLAAAGQTPPWPVPADDVDGVWAECADRYWYRRVLDIGTVATAWDCGCWLRDHSTGHDWDILAERWALGYGYLTRDLVDTRADLTHTTDTVLADPPTITTAPAAFTTLFHAAKLRSNFAGAELASFLDASPLALAAGQLLHCWPVVSALRAFALLRSGDTTSGRELVETVLAEENTSVGAVEICLHALEMATPPQPQLLRDHAAEAVARWPHAHLLHYRHAVGLHQTGQPDAARDALDAAFATLPADGKRTAHHQLQAQYTTLLTRLI